MDALSITIDTLQTRVKAKPVFTLVDSDSWDVASFSAGACIEPMFGMLMLRPRCWEASWGTSTAAPYDKYGVGDFTGLTGAKWTVHDKTGVGGGKYLTTVDSTGNGETAKTATKIGQNAPVVFSFVSYGDGSDYLIYKIGYTASGTADATNGTAFYIYSSGVVEVYRNGSMVGKSGDFNITGSGRGRNTSSQTVEVYIIPCRKKGVLVHSNAGGMFFVPFDDVNDEADDPEIIPDSYFWIQAQGTPNFQFAPMKFNTSGMAYGQASAFKRAPSTGSPAFDFTGYNKVFTTVTNALVWGHRAKAGDTGSVTVSLMDQTGVSAFTADGTAKNCKLRLSLSGSGNYTPFIYGGLYGFEAETDNTEIANVSLMDYLSEAHMAVPDDPSRVEISVTLRNPALIESAGSTKLRTIANRPATVYVGETQLMDARTSDHDYKQANNPENDVLTLTLRDAYKYLERCIIDDPIPLDGLKLEHAVQFLLRYIGFSSAQWDFEATTVRIPDTPRDSGWNLQIKDGDTCASWIKDLYDSYASTWIYGFRPYETGVKFSSASPETLRGIVRLHLYPTIEDAEAYLLSEGLSAEDAAKRARLYVYRSYDEAILEPEANELYVSGRDQYGHKLVEERRDTDAIEPTTVVSARPDNWAGEVLTVGFMDDSLTGEDAIENAADYLEGRLFTFRRLPHWESEMLWFRGSGGRMLPVWRGDTVALHDVAGVEGTTYYQIKSFDGTFSLEVDDSRYDDGQNRPFAYAAEEVTI